MTERQRSLLSRLDRFRTSKSGRRLVRVLQVALSIGIIVYLVVRLTTIGWGNIVSELPRNPLFYLLFLLLYFSLPIGELFIYRVVWPAARAGDTFRAMVKKRVFNRDVMGYSGEVYLYSWARARRFESDGEILKTVRDTNIISSAASTLIAIVLLAVFLYLGHFNIRSWIDNESAHYLILGGIGVGVLALLVWVFRRYLFAMSLRITLIVFAIYGVRLLAGQALQIGQWAVVLPEVALGVWFTFAATALIISRIPFVPNQDLVFLGASVEISGAMDVPAASIASMLLVVSVLDKALNATLFAGISIWERREARRGRDADIHPADAQAAHEELVKPGAGES